MSEWRACNMTLFLFAFLLVLKTAQCFSTSGVPCYLHPSGDGCHYSQKADSPTCTSTKTRAQLQTGVKQLNRSLFSLESQLIRLGVIPPDNACSELPPVDNGGVVYSDLNLAPGTTGRYICNDGFFLQALYGYREFNCTEYGIWDGNVTTTLVICHLIVGRCALPEEIANGNITMGSDLDYLLPGDMVMFSCDEGFELVGADSQYCLRTGNLSGHNPTCHKKKPVTVSGESDRMGMIAGVSVTSSLLFLAVMVITVASIVFLVVKCGLHRNKGRRSSTTDPLVVSDSDLSPRRQSVQYSHIDGTNANKVLVKSGKGKQYRKDELEDSIF